jgi:hypothetical protein
MRFVDLSRRAPRNAIRPDSIYLGLAPNCAVARADPRLLDRELRRGFEPLTGFWSRGRDPVP